jgi:hypothetical protein
MPPSFLHAKAAAVLALLLALPAVASSEYLWCVIVDSDHSRAYYSGLIETDPLDRLRHAEAFKQAATERFKACLAYDPMCSSSPSRTHAEDQIRQNQRTNALFGFEIVSTDWAPSGS